MNKAQRENMKYEFIDSDSETPTQGDRLLERTVALDCQNHTLNANKYAIIREMQLDIANLHFYTFTLDPKYYTESVQDQRNILCEHLVNTFNKYDVFNIVEFELTKANNVHAHGIIGEPTYAKALKGFRRELKSMGFIRSKPINNTTYLETCISYLNKNPLL